MNFSQYIKAILFFFILFLNVLHGEVVDSSSNGFTVKNIIKISASPDQVYKSIIDVGSWWSSDHTYSGNAKNISIEDKAGGCFCEKLESGGSVRHMVVLFTEPGKTIRLSGGLGPLQSMGVTGSLTFSISKSGSETELEMIYTVGGYTPGGLQSLASPVNFVLSEQLARLKSFIENGKPE
jgi:hypothetical protein